MNIDAIKSVYFVGAGGIGMSALVRYFLSLGKKVAGYDRTASELTERLNTEGAAIHYDDNTALIPEACRDKANTLVVYTPAVPQSHSELTWFREQGFEIQKRAQVLGTITRSRHGLCVAGTHGKTTTSSMAAHLIYGSHVGATAFLGGISQNYGTNLLLSDKSDYVVIEADEYDRSFHQLRPHITVITSTDPDHLDIYDTPEAYWESFEHYTSLIQPGGALILHEGLEITPRTQEGVHTYSYSRSQGDFHAENIHLNRGFPCFTLVARGEVWGEVELQVPGVFQIYNCLAAAAAADACGIDRLSIIEGLENFVGACRRMERKGFINDAPVFDDYGHHPTEVKATLEGAAVLCSQRPDGSRGRLHCVFQPHTYSRTAQLYDQFITAFDAADTVILIDIYAARETDTCGVSSHLLASSIGPRAMYASSPAVAAQHLIDLAQPGDIIVVMGAGNVTLVTQALFPQ